jgi:hypothetical protein
MNPMIHEKWDSPRFNEKQLHRNSIHENEIHLTIRILTAKSAKADQSSKSIYSDSSKAHALHGCRGEDRYGWKRKG